MIQDSRRNQDFDNDEITIDLTELIAELWSKFHIILLSGILLALVAFVGTKFLITPMYTSVTKVYVLSKQDSSSGVTYSDLQVGTQLTKDYVELVKSRPVLEQVVAVLNLDMETDELANMITAETQTDTRIITIKIENEDPKRAKEIADAVREAVSIQIKDVMDADSVNTVEDGSLPKAPSSPNVMKNIILGGMLGVLLAAGIIIVRFMMNDTIKTPEDVERYLGLSVLTSVPIQGGSKKSNKKIKKAEKKALKDSRR
ncbi:MAG: YveK family protein [Lachnospiraceae bacterium]